VIFIHHPRSELFKELNWQTVPERGSFQKAILMYRIINNIYPDYLKNYVSYTSDISCRDTRSTNCNQQYLHSLNSIYVVFLNVKLYEICFEVFY